MQEEKQFISTYRLGRLLDIKPQLIYRLVREKRIPYYRVGGRYRFDEQEVLNVLKESSANDQKGEFSDATATSAL